MPEDTTVSTEAPKPTTIREHYDAAKAAQSTTDHGDSPAADNTSRGAQALSSAQPQVVVQEEAKPVEDPGKVADQLKDTTESQDALLTPEELAALPPKDRAKAEKWQAKLTQKAQALAAKEKEYLGIDEWKPLIEAFKTDPGKAMEHIAAQLGMKVQPADAQDTRTVETKTAETLAELPDEWQFLKPVFDQYGKKLMAELRNEIAPVKEAHDQFVSQAVAAETESTMKAFDAKYPGWKKHEGKMLELGKKFVPTAGAMSDFEYLEVLHKLATADIAEAEKTKTVVQAINKAVSASEPSHNGVADNRVDHAIPPPGKRTLRDAFEAAKRGEVWTK